MPPWTICKRARPFSTTVRSGRLTCELVGREAAERHLPVDRAAAGQRAVAHVDGHVAGAHPIAVGGGEQDRADHVDMVVRHIVAGPVGAKAGRAVVELDAGRQARRSRRSGLRIGLQRRSGRDARTAGRHRPGRDTGRPDTFSRSSAAPTLFLSSRKLTSCFSSSGEKNEEGEHHPDQGRQRELQQADQPVVAAAGRRPAALLARVRARRAQTWAKMSCSAQPARSSVARWGRKSKQAWASCGAALARQPLVELLLQLRGDSARRRRHSPSARR